MSRARWFRVLGIAAIVLALAGFATVADDLRHAGELWGTACVLGAGICLLLAGGRSRVGGSLAFQRVALALVAAIPTGAWLDDMPAGIALCVLPGLVLARLRRPGAARARGSTSGPTEPAGRP